MLLKYRSGEIVAKLNKNKQILVSNVDFDICSRKSLALIGETGSGKTMIAYSIMKLLPNNVKQINSNFIFDDEDLSKKKNISYLLGDKIVYIPQNGHENLNPSKKIKYHLYDSLKKVNVSSCDLYNKAIEKLRLVGFSSPNDIMDKYPFELSGGEAQRVVIAISICSNAKLIIADEPTNGLEDERKFEFMNLIDSLFPESARLYITHDISIAKKCDDVIVLCNGRVMEKGNSQEVFLNPKCVYTKALINSLVENKMIPTPILRDQEGNCPFYCRCSQASNKCVKDWRCFP